MVNIIQLQFCQLGFEQSNAPLTSSYLSKRHVSLNANSRVVMLQILTSVQQKMEVKVIVTMYATTQKEATPVIVIVAFNCTQNIIVKVSFSIIYFSDGTCFFFFVNDL